MNLLESFNKRRRKKRFLKIFGLWGSHAAVNFVLDSPLAKPWEKDVLCLVTHLQSFETLFTRFTLSEVGLLINRYYELIAEAVMSSEGDVNQFCGPEVIAHYGLIVPIKEASLATLSGAFREIGLTLESEFQRIRVPSTVRHGPVPWNNNIRIVWIFATQRIYRFRSLRSMCSETLIAKFHIQRLRVSEQGCGTRSRRFDLSS